MQAESAFDPSAVSRTGAMGLMQLMPDIAQAFGVVHPFDLTPNADVSQETTRSGVVCVSGNDLLIF
jgi:soluble lytic murein transglycosylase-like protein